MKIKEGAHLCKRYIGGVEVPHGKVDARDLMAIASDVVALDEKINKHLEALAQYFNIAFEEEAPSYETKIKIVELNK